MLNIVKDNDFSAVESAAAAFVDFNATWCGPCRMVGPIFDELADEYDGKVEFFSVDVDENPDIAAKFGVMSIPTLVMLRNGAETERVVGFRPKEALKQILDK